MRSRLVRPLAAVLLLGACQLQDRPTAVETVGLHGTTASASANERLDVPVVVAVKLAGGRATVVWRTVEDAKGYQLVACRDSSLPTVEKSPAQDTVHTYTGLTPGVEYGVKLRTRKVTGSANAGTNNSKFSDCRSFIAVEPVATIVLSPASASLTVGQQVEMTATLLDRAGMVLTDRDVTWTTSAPAVAMVSSAGMVSAVGAGSVAVTVTSEGITASAAISVREPVASIAMTPAEADLEVGQVQQFSATARDRFGNVLAGRPMTWSSANESVVTIASDGRAFATGAGSALVYASSEGVQQSALVRVSTPVAAADLIADEVLEPVLHVVTFKADGSQRRVITNGVHPTWVGSLVLARGPYQDNRIFAMNPDGSNRRLILGAGPSYVPDLSPDAARMTLVYGDCGGQHRIATANADGSGLRILGPCGAIPRWSPSGNRIVFTTGGDLFTIRSDGADLQRVSTGTSAFAAAFSPDGRSLVFDSYVAGRGRLMVMNADGSNLRPLLAPAASASDELPDWSPDGRWIAFRSSRSGKYEIWRVRPDGTGLTQITQTVLPQGLVRWRR